MNQLFFIFLYLQGVFSILVITHKLIIVYYPYYFTKIRFIFERGVDELFFSFNRIHIKFHFWIKNGQIRFFTRFNSAFR